MNKGEVSRLLQELVSIDGPSGLEGPVRDAVQRLGNAHADDVRVDPLGSVILRRNGAPEPPGRIMIAAHMDEIGMIVTKVDEGFLHIGKVGGIDPRSLIGQEVTVYPSGAGAERYPDGLPGYVGARPPHVLSPADREKVVPLDALRVDVGLNRSGRFDPNGGSDQSKALIRVGDRVVPRGAYTELIAGRAASKALDNRASVAAMLGALGYLAGMKHTWEVYAVATVQEEIGVRGAITSGYGVAPDVAVAIDVTFGQTPGLNESDTVEMDKGPAIAWGPNLHPGIVRRLREAAEAMEIPFCSEPLPGNTGTDAWALQVSREGIPTGLLGIPVRYMHSPVETVALADIDRAARLLAAFISQLDDAVLANLPEEV